MKQFPHCVDPFCTNAKHQIIPFILLIASDTII